MSKTTLLGEIEDSVPDALTHLLDAIPHIRDAFDELVDGANRRLAAKRDEEEPEPVAEGPGAFDRPAAAVYLSVKPSKLDALRRAGAFPRIRIGKSWYYARADLDKYLRTRKRE